MSPHTINPDAYNVLYSLCTGVSCAYGATMCDYFNDTAGIRGRQPASRFPPIQLETSINHRGEAVLARRYYDQSEMIDKVDLFIMGLTPNTIFQLSPKEVKRHSPEYGNYHHPSYETRVTLSENQWTKTY